MARRRPHLALSVVGGEGDGKTRFLLTAPKPLHVVSVDPNTKYVRDQLITEGLITKSDVTLHQFRLPALAFTDKDDVKEEATETWEAIIDVLRPLAAGDGEAASVGLDTASELYDLNVLQAFGKLDQISPEARRNMMGPVNQRYKGLVRALQDQGLNVVLLHRAAEKWEDKTIRGRNGIEDTRVKMTGPFDIERKGFKDTGFITSVEIFLKFDANRESKTLAGKYGMKIVRNGHRPALCGAEYWGRQKLPDGSRIARASFPFLMAITFPATTVEDWK